MTPDKGRRPTQEEREALRRAELDEYARRVVADSPPLTPEQLNKIATLLGPSSRLLRQ